jgi:predicted DNA-binding transcriptional regulator AlpA
MSTSTIRPRLLKVADAARYCGESKPTFRRYRLKGGGPAYIKVGDRVVFYELSELDRWIDERKARAASVHRRTANAA